MSAYAYNSLINEDFLKFKRGDRVKLNDFYRLNHNRSKVLYATGTVIKNQTMQKFLVKWDHRKTPSSYHESYLDKA